MKIQRLVTIVTAARFLVGVENVFGVVLGMFWEIQTVFVFGDPLCDLEILSAAFKTLFMVI